MTPNRLKLPEGLIKKSNELNLSAQLEFYYNLKGMRVEGYFKRTEILYLKNKLQIGLSTVYKLLGEVIRLGWIRSTNLGFELISYDKLFEFFKYSLKQKKTGRKGNFKIFKVAIKDYKLGVFYEEIKLNIQRQQYVINKKIKKLSPTNQFLMQKNILDFNYIENNFGINLLYTLSCRGVSRILGFKSSSKGHEILTMLESNKYLTLEKRVTEHGLPKLSILHLSI